MVAIRTVQESGQGSLIAFLELVDGVFLKEKSRSGSLLERYPQLFHEDNHRNLYAAWQGRRLIGTTAIKEFNGNLAGRLVHGAMVGLVGVHPDFRRMGIGRKLIASVSNSLASRNLDFSVLWTTSPTFYSPIGWSSGDCGAYGTLSNSQQPGYSLTASRLSESVQEIEQVRRVWQTMCLSRSAIDYDVVPTGVDCVYCLRVGRSSFHSAYTIFGCNGNTGVVYELVGNPDYFDELWNEITGRFAKIYVNDWEGSLSYDWLLRNTPLTWKRQSLSMWMAFDESWKSNQQAICIPYYDRI
ncbi:MAG: GNAT family N-acetyltransferase [Planctomycetales bacterium]|nr:GNAT family N-acetyltransferase [Planctomycetales bacterium]